MEVYQRTCFKYTSWVIVDDQCRENALLEHETKNIRRVTIDLEVDIILATGARLEKLKASLKWPEVLALFPTLAWDSPGLEMLHIGACVEVVQKRRYLLSISPLIVADSAIGMPTL